MPNRNARNLFLSEVIEMPFKELSNVKARERKLGNGFHHLGLLNYPETV